MLQYGTRHILDSIQASSGHHISNLFMSGGLARNDVYTQAHADATGCPVLRPLQSDCMLLGCAMLAAGAGRVYEGMGEAVRGMASEASIVRPVPERKR